MKNRSNCLKSFRPLLLFLSLIFICSEGHSTWWWTAAKAVFRAVVPGVAAGGTAYGLSRFFGDSRSSSNSSSSHSHYYEANISDRQKLHSRINGAIQLSERNAKAASDRDQELGTQIKELKGTVEKEVKNLKNSVDKNTDVLKEIRGAIYLTSKAYPDDDSLASVRYRSAVSVSGEPRPLQQLDEEQKNCLTKAADWIAETKDQAGFKDLLKKSESQFIDVEIIDQRFTLGNQTSQPFISIPPFGEIEKTFSNLTEKEKKTLEESGWKFKYTLLNDKKKEVKGVLYETFNGPAKIDLVKSKTEKPRAVEFAVHLKRGPNNEAICELPEKADAFMQWPLSLQPALESVTGSSDCQSHYKEFKGKRICSGLTQSSCVVATVSSMKETSKCFKELAQLNILMDAHQAASENKSDRTQ